MISRAFKSDSHIPKKPETLKDARWYTKGLKPDSYKYWSALSDYRAKKIENQTAWDEWEKSALENAKGVPEKKEGISKVIKELEQVKGTLLKAGAKTFYELHPTAPKHTLRSSYWRQSSEPKDHETSFEFSFVPEMTDLKKEGYKKLFEATWENDFDTIESLTLSGSKDEPPLRIAVQDANGFSPFAIAVLRGHHELARKIIQICITQYHKDDGVSSRQRWTMRADSDDECYSEDSDDEDNRKYFSATNIPAPKLWNHAYLAIQEFN